MVPEAMCVATSDDEYVCLDDPMNLRKSSDKTYLMNKFHQLDRGVKQRIDGSETEKEAVKGVLKRMDDYFLNEVLAKSEYEGIRNRCRNLNELCAFWASVGECESNRIFMLGNCAAACRLCLLANTNIL
eukprot:CAMPEP_0116863764 /NCGR_PEP_ID=MMETSP0418-20121206/24420_1 /TAXON_ID=1158023 /ORGANISM="Astrosyne radiata, Strain 13vi08-1A" /LENGTH=128 /DNA_ID=CAMNT_0004498855 /DNA_START=197 /DNA_END=583 /DNA_ORIENTATION=-